MRVQAMASNPPSRKRRGQGGAPGFKRPYGTRILNVRLPGAEAPGYFQEGLVEISERSYPATFLTGRTGRISPELAAFLQK
jgi:hypothetical protein